MQTHLLLCLIGMVLSPGSILRVSKQTNKSLLARAFTIPPPSLQRCLSRRHSPRLFSANRDQEHDVKETKQESCRGKFVFTIETPDDMAELGGLLAVLSCCPTTLLLDGDLGAGKTALARGFLRAATDNPDLLVTSPTYLLANVYQGLFPRIFHMDLYRLDQKETVTEVQDLLRPLNLDQIFANDVSLVEWPSRLGPAYAHAVASSQRADQQEEGQEGDKLETETPLWPILPADRLEIDIRIRPSKHGGRSYPQGNNGDDQEEFDDRIVTVISVGEKWTTTLQNAVDDGLVDDFLFLDDQD